MMTGQAWQPGMKDIHIFSVPRHRSHLKKPKWIIIVVSLFNIFIICAYVYPLQNSAAWSLFSSNGCNTFEKWLPPAPARELTDSELASQVDNEDKFTVYVHASKDKPVHFSHYFVNSEIHSEKVIWGKISMVDAENRLLARALEDTDNQHFVLLSDSCVPLHNFDYVYNFLMYTNVSYIDCFEDPGPHGSGRYNERMLPEVEKNNFRKGAQWFTMKRQHAIVIMADGLYYSKFRDYCRMHDPTGIANWSVTHVDWSEGKWHPKSYKAEDVTWELIKNITSITDNIHVTSDAMKEVTISPCLWNGSLRPCYLFARKFLLETLDNLIRLFPNYTSIGDWR